MEENNATSLIDELDERIKGLNEALEREAYGSDKYEAIVSYIDKLTKVRESYVKAEQQRLDSNAKNDIAEAELIIKQREAKNGKWRNIVSGLGVIGALASSALYVVGSIMQNRESYQMEETTLPYKSGKDSAKSMMNRVK